MAIPETLQHKIDLYQREGRIVREGAELFAEVGWLQVMHGQGLRARSYHPLANLPAEADVAGYLESVRSVMARCADLMPTHEEFIAKYCQAASRDPVSP
jgi:tryptophan halogenase